MGVGRDIRLQEVRVLNKGRQGMEDLFSVRDIRPQEVIV
jgi:hypothetical protein